MRVRWIGLALALVLLGLAAGYGLASRSDGDPTQVGAARPMAAVDPAWPAAPAVVVPDSTFPALATGSKTHPETVGSPVFPTTIPIPNGWVRSNSAPGEWRWYPNDDFEQNLNTYFLRVGQVANRHQPVPVAVAERIAALGDATSVVDLDVESRTDDGFTATYVSGEHRRVTMERFLPGGDDGDAVILIALIGREVDRAGMADLFPRIVNGVNQ